MARRVQPPRIPAVDMTWMRKAACRHMPDLPWIAERAEGPVVLRDLMAQLCEACPVRDACARFVIEGDVTAGFWAGRDRNLNVWTFDGRRSVQETLFDDPDNEDDGPDFGPEYGDAA